MSERQPWLTCYREGVRYHLKYPDTPVHGLLGRAAATSPDGVALTFFGRDLPHLEELPGRGDWE